MIKEAIIIGVVVAVLSTVLCVEVAHNTMQGFLCGALASAGACLAALGVIAKE